MSSFTTNVGQESRCVFVGSCADPQVGSQDCKQDWLGRRLDWGKTVFQAHLGCWQNSFPYGCRTESSSFPLVRGWRPTTVPRGCQQWLEATCGAWSHGHTTSCLRYQLCGDRLQGSRPARRRLIEHMSWELHYITFAIFCWCEASHSFPSPSHTQVVAIHNVMNSRRRTPCDHLRVCQHSDEIWVFFFHL